MNYNEIIKILEGSIVSSKGTRLQRIMKHPIKLLYSKILEYVAVLFKMHVRVKAKTFWNRNMYVIIPEIVSLTIYRYGFYEEGLTKLLLKYLKPGMTFMDIGAHFGYFSLLGSALVGNKGWVHSFEPTPRTFNILRSNALNKSNIIINNCGVFSERKKMMVNDYGPQYSAYNSIYDARLPEDSISKLAPDKFEIETISVDEYVRINNISPNFIKIDAESSEYEILCGMEHTINNFHPFISVEVGDFGVRNAPASLSLVEFLTNRGYSACEFREGKILPYISKSGKHPFANILFLPDH